MSTQIDPSWFATEPDAIDTIPDSEETLTPTVISAQHLPPLEPGSPLARACFEAFSGRAVTIIKSPPGAGKTTLVADLAAQLFLRSDMQIGVLTPTNQSGGELVARLVDKLGLDADGRPRVAATSGKIPHVDGAENSTGFAGSRMVEVSTIASMRGRTFGRNRGSEDPDFDLLIVDEAYQCTFNDVASACDFADQVLLVGDPGQIGPVVTINTEPFRDDQYAPHVPAPHVFETRDDAVVIHLESTYRLGQATVDAIGCLYDFEFDSKRLDRHITDSAGNGLAEIRAMEVDAQTVRSHIPTMQFVAEQANNLVGAIMHTIEPDGVTEYTLEPKDVAVVVSHVDQTQAVRACLDGLGLQDTIVGTADSLQGSQWPAVVSLDPLFGHEDAGHHSAATGRLCVMTSRHMAHLTWIHDGTWRDKLGALKSADARRGIKVRDALTR